ncbi:MAG: tRNA 2-thiouridine synthesizing protein A [Candidatus Endobugula sp.]|jgi:tRNA 2-thiouridine synthesizing protein A
MINVKNLIVKTIDAKGLSCPLPLLKAKQGLHQVSTDECVEVLATDAGSVRDFHAFIALTDHRMIEFTEYDDHYRYIIKKA